METIATAPGVWEYSTTPEYNDGNQARKNQKISGCFKALFEKKNDTTPGDELGWESVMGILEGASNLKAKYGNFILAYQRENELNYQNVLNRIYLKEYEPQSKIKTLDSLAKMGEKMFGDARSNTEEEADVVSSFVRSKSKKIFSKKL